MFLRKGFRCRSVSSLPFVGARILRSSFPASILRDVQREHSVNTDTAVVSDLKASNVVKTKIVKPHRDNESTCVQVDSVAVGDSPVVCVTEEIGDSKSHRRRQAFHVDLEGNIKAEPMPSLSLQSRLTEKAEISLSLVLPRGYPESVGDQYGTYAAWQFSAMAASAAAGVMSTQALLYAMGMGASAIPLAATLNWVIKDGLGQLGGVAFSSLVNTRFDANPKLWRVVAAVSLDASTVLELMAPLAPSYFLLIASVANVGKNISFLAASASRAAIHNVLSAKGNLADITAKAGAQTILACMVGTGAGVALSALLGSEWHTIWPTCLGLSVVHLLANHMSVRDLAMPTIDSQRLKLIVDSYHIGRGVPSPRDLTARESMTMNSIRSQLGMNPPPRIIIGSRVEDALGDQGELDGLCKICQGRPFILAVRGCNDKSIAEVHVLLLEGCGTREVLAASYAAHLARKLLLDRGLRGSRHHRGGVLGKLFGWRAPGGGQVLYEVIKEALMMADGLSSDQESQRAPLRPEVTDRRRKRGGGIASDFVARAVRAGWDLSVLFLEEPGSPRVRLMHGDISLLGNRQADSLMGSITCAGFPEEVPWIYSVPPANLLGKIKALSPIDPYGCQARLELNLVEG